MRISEVTVKNFKCLGPEEIRVLWDDILILVGENNTGKSGFLQAIDVFFENKETLPARYFRNFGQTPDGEVPPIEIIVRFKNLTDEDKLQTGVRNRLTDQGEWVLRKVYTYTEGERSDGVKYLTYNRPKSVGGVREDSTWVSIRRRFTDLEITRGKRDRGRVGADMSGLIDELLQKHPEEVSVEKAEDWDPNPGGIQSHVNGLLEKNAQYVFVRAVHDAKAESEGSKSSFSQLFNLLIKQKVDESGAMDHFKRALIEVVGLYKKDTNGNRSIPEITSIEQEISEKVSRIISASTSIDTAELDENKISQSVLPIPTITMDDGYRARVEDQGHGLQRALILAILQSLAEHKTEETRELGPKNILLIEEPELYMHPQMERKMRDALYAIARDGAFQVICTTHSPIFLDMADKHRSIVIFEKDSDRNINRKQVSEEIFVGEEFKDQKNRLKMIISFDPSVNELFFARRIVLVEGDSEIAALGRAAELLGVDKKSIRDTTLISCRGKGTVPGFMKVLNNFGKKYFVMHDSGGNDSFNQKIETLATESDGLAQVKQLPGKLETVLAIPDPSKEDKPIQAFKRVEELSATGELDAKFGEYVRFVYGVESGTTGGA